MRYTYSCQQTSGMKNRLFGVLLAVAVAIVPVYTLFALHLANASGSAV